MNAMQSGLRAGPAAVRSAAEATSPEVDYTEVKRLKEDTFAPMQRDKGLLPVDVVREIRDLYAQDKYSFFKNKDRIEEALSRIKEIQERFPELWAKDGHGLMRCNEARSRTVCGEIAFRAALARTESRGWHYREDYPQRDDKNWLKWVIVKQEGGKAIASTEPIPIDNYKFKP